MKNAKLTKIKSLKESKYNKDNELVDITFPCDPKAGLSFLYFTHDKKTLEEKVVQLSVVKDVYKGKSSTLIETRNSLYKLEMLDYSINDTEFKQEYLMMKPLPEEEF